MCPADREGCPFLGQSLLQELVSSTRNPSLALAYRPSLSYLGSGVRAMQLLVDAVMDGHQEKV